MEKFYCPYCGEHTLSSHQKFIQKKHATTIGNKVSNQLWFTCPNCHQEVVQEWRKPVKKNPALALLFLAVLAMLLVFTVIHFEIGIYVCGSVMMTVVLLLSLAGKDQKIFVRKEGDYRDILVDATIHLQKNNTDPVGEIFLLRPHKEHLQKTSVSREYIVGVHAYAKGTQTCKLRMIKPKEDLPAAFSFDIYCEDIFVGTGNIID